MHKLLAGFCQGITCFGSRSSTVELRSPTFIIRMLDLAIAAAITSLEFSSFEIHKVIRSCTDAYLDIGHPLGGVIDLTKPVNTRQSVYT